jgi:hypothetical protein
MMTGVSGDKSGKLVGTKALDGLMYHQFGPIRNCRMAAHRFRFIETG